VKKVLIGLALILVCALILGCSTPATTPPSAASPSTQPTAIKPAQSAAPTQPATQTAPSSAATSPTPQYGGILKMLSSSWGPVADIGYPPEFGFSGGDATPVLEGLLYVDNRGNPSPCLATAWEVSADKKSIKISLRKGVKFHDMTDFNAQAAKWAMDNQIAVKRVPLWESVEIIDDYTLKLNLKNWSNSAILSLASRLYISQAAFQKNGIEWVRANPVGTGAFKFLEYKQEVYLKYTRFDSYWQKGLPYLDGVEFEYIADKMTLAAAFQAGEGQIMRMATVKTSTELRDKGYELWTRRENAGGGPAGVQTLFPDSKNADSPLSNLKVRLAIDYAIDKAGICKARSYGFWKPQYEHAFPGSIAEIKNPDNRQYDPAKAKQLLTEAGYPNGFKTRIILEPGLGDKDAAVGVQNQLGAIGITAQVEFPDTGKWNDYRQKGWSNGLLMAGFGFGPNFADSLKGWLSQTAVLNTSVFIPDAYQAAIEEALATLTMEPAKMQALQKQLYDQEVVIPLWGMSEPYDLQPGILHGHGLFGLSENMAWTPEFAWMSKK
jgi:peptide/nickel transport system substrate-binding protein